MDYNSKYTGEQVEELLDKINASPEDVATPSGNYPDMTVGKASQADTAAKAINADNATNATNATTAEQATKATTADYATTAGQATTAESAKTAMNADRATTAEHATTAESTTHADTATKADFATDLTGRNEATAEEFTLRPSAGNKSIRDDSATIKRIKGNSIVWNQMISTPPVMPYANRCNLSISGNDINATVNSIEYDYVGFYYSLPDYRHPKTVNGHTYFISGLFSCPKQATIAFGVGISSITQLVSANTLYSYNTIQKQTSDAVGAMVTCWIEDMQVGDTFKVQNWNVIDLTAMFGAGNEPDTVEEFRALFPGNHYEYNPGQLVSMTANGLFTNGFNQWDEQWENGAYSYWANGTKVDHPEYIRSTNFIRVIPAKTYCLNIASGDAPVCFYDENNNFLGQASFSHSNNYRIFQVPANCQKITFYTKATTYNNNICINLSHTGVENGKYEPYWDATKDLSIIQKYFPNGMRSAGSIYDEISFDETTQKWVAIQRVGNVDLGSLSWEKDDRPNSTITWRFKTGIINNVPQSGAILNILSSKYTTDISPIGQENVDDTIIIYNGRIYIEDTSYTDAAAFKSALAGVILNYELAEPIITVIEEPVNLSYKVGDFGIEQILSDSFSAPFRADIIYQFNATDRIRENSSNIEKLSKTQNEYLLLAGGTMSGQLNSQDIKPVKDSTYQLGDSTHKYKNVFSDFFTGNLEGNAKTATVATDLSGRVEATPEVFTYRPSAGEKSIKDDNAFIRRVKGNSVIWNQQLKTLFSPNVTTDTVTSNGITFTRLSSGGYNISGSNNTSDAALSNNIRANLELQAGHKYVIIPIGLKKSTISFYGPASGVSSFVTADMCIITPTNSASVLLRSVVQAGVIDVNETIYCNVHDLTQMFGIGNEPTTVEEFRALYPDSYYPYNTGELRNLVCNGIKTVGFNQWDEQWEVGSINQEGGNTPSTTMFRSVGYMQILQQKYCVKQKEGQTLGLRFYDENKVHISGCNRGIVNTITTLIPPPNAAYMRFVCTTSNTYNNDICINLSHTGVRDGEYEPYKEVTHSLPLSQITKGEPLRKAGSVYDEINETEYIKRVGVVDLGSLTYWKSDNYPNLFIANPFGAAGADADKIANLFCPKYIAMTARDPWGDIISMGMDTSNQLYIYDPQYTDIEAFKSAMSGIMLNYELAEPIVTPIETPIDFNYYVEDFGTEEALLAEDSAPFSADIVYQFNATDQIRNNSRNIQKLQKSAFTPRGTSAQYIRGDGSYGNRFELSQSTPINNGEFEITDEGDRQFILTPNYYAKSQVTLDNTTTIAVFVTAPEDSHYLAEYWFEFAADDTLPNIEYYQPNNSGAVFRIAGDMMTGAVNILHLISSDGGNTFFGEIRSYSL